MLPRFLIPIADEAERVDAKRCEGVLSKTNDNAAFSTTVASEGCCCAEGSEIFDVETMGG